jgi:hypothetical protein
MPPSQFHPLGTGLQFTGGHPGFTCIPGNRHLCCWQRLSAIMVDVMHLMRHHRTAGPVGKELLKAAATEGLEAFRGGLEWQSAAAEAEQAALRVHMCSRSFTQQNCAARWMHCYATLLHIQQCHMQGEHDESGRDGADITLEPEAEKQVHTGC